MRQTLREKKLQKLLELEQSFIFIQDTDILLERLLSEARACVHADAGSIYIRENDKLRIRFAQNDTQQKTLQPGEKLPFSHFSFPIDEKSISGYSVLTSKLINIPDVYKIKDSNSYSFNYQSDLITGYKTKSLLTLPLVTRNGNVLGVLQMINALDSKGNIVPFDSDAELFLLHFASIATQALEKTILTRTMVMRMIKMAELRDPKETGVHVLRVSNIALEIYDGWAAENNIPNEEKEKFRDELKIASMLHDVGKVGISDLILKKDEAISSDEYEIIKTHTKIGASLFFDGCSSLDNMARDVALHHHEFWNGKGYPGNIDISSPTFDAFKTETCERGLSGKDIPLAARIVAIADVFDALSSKRIYKSAWKESDVLEEIQNQSGKQFDPELVAIFFKILDRIRVIQNSFPD